MPKVNQYRRLAEEARQMAHDVSDEAHGDALLKIAKGYDNLADQLERRRGQNEPESQESLPRDSN